MSVTVFRNARIFTPDDQGKPHAGQDQGSLVSYDVGALLMQDGLIVKIGPERDVLAALERAVVDEAKDCQGKCLVPGFVDPHTHNCFASLRESEFALRLSGTPYLEILKQGGGILSSVKAVANASIDDLYANTKKQVLRALSLGTTTMEIKSGYGLDTVNELKMLEAINRVSMHTPVDIRATFLGAHAVPLAYRGKTDEFISMAIDEMLPAVARQGIAKQCDIFCEKGVFTIAQGHRLLSAAIAMGLKVKLHAD
ncbi:MAG: imidazolonepropionase, partial [Deltaproteobacteria bacterium]|nr:imidazolonepropionase [Deltaproteobacteria bacterium]